MSFQESSESPILTTVREHMRTPLATWAERLDAGLDRFALGETVFRAYTDVPEESSDEVVLVGGEHGNSFWAQHDRTKPNPALVRAHIIRDSVDPRATLVYVAGDAYRENNLNFTELEINHMRTGTVTPLADRWRTILESLPNSEDLRIGTGFGMSLGARVLTDLMIHNDTVLNSAVFVEAPNVQQRTARELGAAFRTSGGHLADNIRLNADPAESEVAAEHIKSVNPFTLRGALGMGRYVAGLALPGNRALIHPMLEATLSPAINASLARQERVVHAWGTKANVSPAAANRAIAELFEPDENYTAFEMDETHADHSLTNIYGLMGALAREAVR